MIQTGIEINKIAKFIKEYLSVLIVIPAFIGGVWQAIELMNISYSYIRFFSISQIVPDGILILMFFIIIFLFSVILIYLIELFGESKKEYDIHPKESTYIFIFLYLCVMVFPFIFLSFDKPIIQDLIIITITMISGAFYLNEYLAKSYRLALDKYKKFYKYCNILLLIFYLTYIFYFSVCIHHIFLSPSNNINIEQVKKDVASKFPNTKQKLLYFNDKYIFINITYKPTKDKKGKLIKAKSDKVYITKLDNLFNN